MLILQKLFGGSSGERWLNDRWMDERVASVVAEYGLDEHEACCLRGAFLEDGELSIIALPSSQTGRRLISARLGKAINAGPTPWGYDTCGDLVATQEGREVWAYLRGEMAPPAAPSWTPGDSAFWLDPELWVRTPTLPDGRLDWCWNHLP